MNCALEIFKTLDRRSPESRQLSPKQAGTQRATAAWRSCSRRQCGGVRCSSDQFSSQAQVQELRYGLERPRGANDFRDQSRNSTLGESGLCRTGVRPVLVFCGAARIVCRWPRFAHPDASCRIAIGAQPEYLATFESCGKGLHARSGHCKCGARMGVAIRPRSCTAGTSKKPGSVRRRFADSRGLEAWSAPRSPDHRLAGAWYPSRPGQNQSRRGSSVSGVGRGNPRRGGLHVRQAARARARSAAERAPV
jgi:hypothetical protein